MSEPSPQPNAPRPKPVKLELTLPADHRFSRLGRRVVERLATEQGLDPRRIEELSLVTSELLSNSVDHARPDSAPGSEAVQSQPESGAPDLSGLCLPPLTMRLAVEIGADGWELSIADQGGGDPAALERHLASSPEDALEAVDPDAERGRGLLLLRSFVDRLTAEPTPDGRGLCLRVSKHWS